MHYQIIEIIRKKDFLINKNSYTVRNSAFKRFSGIAAFELNKEMSFLEIISK